MPSRFSNIFDDAKSGDADKGEAEGERADFWQSLEQPPKVATTRVNFDLDSDIDRRLMQRAFDLGISKSELLRRMVVFLLEG